MSGTCTPHPLERATSACICHPAGAALAVHREGELLRVDGPPAGAATRWRLHRQDGEIRLQLAAASADLPSAAHWLAVLEAAFTFDPGIARLTLPSAPPATHAELQALGLVPPGPADRAVVHRDMLFQHAALWLPQPPAPMPLRYTRTGDRRHPIRPAKRSGLLYQRHMPWLSRTFSFRSLEMAVDLPRFHRWMNDPDVAQVWQEEGDLARHRHYLDALEADPHMQAMIACIDGEPFGYFETYWAKENRIAPFYDADDYDRGWHVLIGEPSFRGKAWATAWLTSISHYLFLADPRTRRIVGEPRADHRQQLRNLDRSGYAKLKAFDFPHKRAMLVMLLRERYFTDTLWWPRDDEPAASPSPSSSPARS